MVHDKLQLSESGNLLLFWPEHRKQKKTRKSLRKSKSVRCGSFSIDVGIDTPTGGGGFTNDNNNNAGCSAYTSNAPGAGPHKPPKLSKSFRLLGVTDDGNS